MLKLDQKLRQNTVNWLLKKFDGTHYYKQYTWAAKQTFPRENQVCSPNNEKYYFGCNIKYCCKDFLRSISITLQK